MRRSWDVPGGSRHARGGPHLHTLLVGHCGSHIEKEGILLKRHDVDLDVNQILGRRDQVLLHDQQHMSNNMLLVLAFQQNLYHATVAAEGELVFPLCLGETQILLLLCGFMTMIQSSLLPYFDPIRTRYTNRQARNRHLQRTMR